MSGQRVVTALAAAALVVLLGVAALFASVSAAAGRATCSIATSDPQVTFDDAVDVDVEGKTLRSLRWTSDRTTRTGAAESHAFECVIAMDARTSIVKRTSHGWTATSLVDPACRLEVLGDGTHLALVPACRAACSTGRPLHPLAVNVDSGLCRPLDGRPTERLKP